MIKKVNVFQNQGAARERKLYKFVDEYTGKEYEIELRALDDMERESMREHADRLTQRYVTGGITDPQGDFREKPEVILLDLEDGTKRRIDITEDSCYHFAELEWMQDFRREVFDDQPRDGAYNAIELAIIGATTSIWPELIQTKGEVRRGGIKKKVHLGSDGKSPMQPSDQATESPLSGST